MGLIGLGLARPVIALALVAIIVGMNIVFFRHLVRPRLAANIGVVLLFGAFRHCEP